MWSTAGCCETCRVGGWANGLLRRAGGAGGARRRRNPTSARPGERRRCLPSHGVHGSVDGPTSLASRGGRALPGRMARPGAHGVAGRSSRPRLPAARCHPTGSSAVSSPDRDRPDLPAQRRALPAPVRPEYRCGHGGAPPLGAVQDRPADPRPPGPQRDRGERPPRRHRRGRRRRPADPAARRSGPGRDAPELA